MKSLPVTRFSYPLVRRLIAQARINYSYGPREPFRILVTAPEDSIFVPSFSSLNIAEIDRSMILVDFELPAKARLSGSSDAARQSCAAFLEAIERAGLFERLCVSICERVAQAQSNSFERDEQATLLSLETESFRQVISGFYIANVISEICSASEDAAKFYAWLRGETDALKAAKYRHLAPPTLVLDFLEIYRLLLAMCTYLGEIDVVVAISNLSGLCSPVHRFVRDQNWDDLVKLREAAATSDRVDLFFVSTLEAVLDPKRGVASSRRLSEALGLDIFASRLGHSRSVM